MTSLYISVEEAHKLTTLSRATLYRAFADGTIKTAKVRGPAIVPAMSMRYGWWPSGGLRQSSGKMP